MAVYNQSGDVVVFVGKFRLSRSKAGHDYI